MTRHRAVPWLIVTSGLFSMLLAVAVLRPYGWMVWPFVAVLAFVGVGLVLWLRRPVDPVPAPVVPRGLPAAPLLVGRGAERAAVQGAIAGGAQLIVVAGAPGTGCSALALRVARDVRDQFPDGQLCAGLRGGSADPVPPGAVLVRFLRALGCADDLVRGDVGELAARFRSVVGGRRVLVLLDDARDAAQVRELLPGGPGSLVLVTSRVLLSDLLGAVVVRVGALGADAALDLLVQTVGLRRLGGDADGARRLVAACGGLPLAVRVAAGQVLRGHPAPALADRLTAERRRLDSAARPVFPVRPAVEVLAAVRVAYAGMTVLEQVVFRRAGGHPGAEIGLGAAAARCALDEHAVAEALESLAEAFLVEVAAPERYRWHDVLRLIAQEFAGDEATQCLRRQVQWLTAHARVGQWLAQERENVIAVVRAALRAGLVVAARSLVGAVLPLVGAPGDEGYRSRLGREAEGR
jgi:hypothetical protein